MIERILSLRDAGMAMDTIAETLNAEGVTPRSGSQWYGSKRSQCPVACWCLVVSKQASLREVATTILTNRVIQLAQEI